MKTYKVKIKNPVMGVPITFLNNYNPDQFEILGLDSLLYGDRFYINQKRLYARILIRRKITNN